MNQSIIKPFWLTMCGVCCIAVFSCKKPTSKLSTIKGSWTLTSYSSNRVESSEVFSPSYTKTETETSEDYDGSTLTVTVSEKITTDSSSTVTVTETVSTYESILTIMSEGTYEWFGMTVPSTITVSSSSGTSITSVSDAYTQQSNKGAWSWSDSDNKNNRLLLENSGYYVISENSKSSLGLTRDYSDESNSENQLYKSTVSESWIFGVEGE